MHLTLLAGLVASVTIWLWRRQTRWRAAIAGRRGGRAIGRQRLWSGRLVAAHQRSVYMLWRCLGLCGRYPLGVGRAWALALCRAVLTLDPCRLVAGLLAVVFRRGADDLGGRRAVGALP